MNVWVIIPAFNEATSLSRLLPRIKSKNLSIIVVDDGSGDNTYAVAEGAADIVIRNDKNSGKGRSLNKAITYLLERENFDYIVTMDADGQHSPSDIDNLLEEAERGADVVVGNRMGHPVGMPQLRILTNKFMSWLISRIARQKIPDTQCGFRLIKKDVLEKVKLTTRKFEIESEILIKASRAGFSIRSVPVKSIYSKNRRSRINPFVDTARFIKFIFRSQG